MRIDQNLTKKIKIDQMCLKCINCIANKKGDVVTNISKYDELTSSVKESLLL